MGFFLPHGRYGGRDGQTDLTVTKPGQATPAFRTLDDVDVRGKRVLVRVDLNVPTADGVVSDLTRVTRILPTLRELCGKGAKVILLSHFGRPTGAADTKNSMRAIAPAVARELGRPVAFAEDCIGTKAQRAVAALKDGDVLLLENARFHDGETKNDAAFVAELAALGDVYVNDAFSAAHRAHATTEGLAHALPAFAGRTMQAELEHLSLALSHPERPVAAIVGGAKISTKLDLLGNLVKRVDILIIGGGMANTFLFAQGTAVGTSLCEKDMAETSRAIMATAREAKCEIVLPVDGVVADRFAAGAPDEVVPIDAVPADKMILDIGPQTIARIEALLQGVRTLVWNGPFGAFEIKPFDRGTVRVAQVAAALTKAGKLITVAGGGDTVAALNIAGVSHELTYLSTAGGAFLEWLEGKSLPGVEALRRA